MSDLKACKHPGFFRGYCEGCETYPIEDKLRADLEAHKTLQLKHLDAYNKAKDEIERLKKQLPISVASGFSFEDKLNEEMQYTQHLKTKLETAREALKKLDDLTYELAVDPGDTFDQMNEYTRKALEDTK